MGLPQSVRPVDNRRRVRRSWHSVGWALFESHGSMGLVSNVKERKKKIT